MAPNSPQYKSRLVWAIKSRAGWLAASQTDMPASETYFTVGLLLAQKLAELRWSALIQVGLGEVRRAQHHYEEARALFESSLAHFQTATRTLHRSLALPPLAASYVESLTHVFVKARAHLEPSVCAEARARGKTLTLTQALDQAKQLLSAWDKVSRGER